MSEIKPYWELLANFESNEELILDTLKRASQEDQQAFMEQVTQWRSLPQPYPHQLRALNSDVDVLLIGGSKGSAKSFTALMRAVKDIGHPYYECALFRRQKREVEQPGGLWSVATTLYPKLGGVPTGTTFKFPATNSSIKFTYLDDINDARAYDGAQIPFYCFDEVQFMDEEVVTYLLTRMRTPIPGVKCQSLMTCNPLPRSWLARWLMSAGYVDSSTGFPVEEMSGKIKYLYFESDENGDSVIQWHDGEKIEPVTGRPLGYSFTFMPSSVLDNKVLMENNPGYYAQLAGQPYRERMRSLYGCWLSIDGEGSVFQQKHLFLSNPSETKPIREFWSYDTASSQKQSACDSAGIKWVVDDHGYLWIRNWWKSKLKFPELAARIKRDLLGNGGLIEGAVEYASSGIQIEQTLEDDVKIVGVKLPPRTDLYIRSLPLQQWIENGWILFHPDCPRIKELWDLMIAYDGETKLGDDVISAMSIGLTYAQSSVIGSALPNSENAPSTLTYKSSDEILDQINVWVFDDIPHGSTELADFW